MRPQPRHWQARCSALHWANPLPRTPHLATAACSSSSLRPSWARSSSTRCCCSTICSCSSELSPSSRRFSFSSSWRPFSSFRRRSGNGSGGPCSRAPHPHTLCLAAPTETQGPALARCKTQLSVSLLFPASLPDSRTLSAPPRPLGQPLLLLAASLPCPLLPVPSATSCA